METNADKSKKKKKKLKSKVSTIKKLIAMDPFHPGTLSVQQRVRKDGTRGKKYYSWQSSYHGKKYAYRIPDENVDEIRELISDAKSRSKTEDRKDLSVFKSYQKVLKELMDANAKIRKQNGENAVGS